MIGQTISHYKITAKLGEGGMGEVYLATDTSLDRQVALKFLPESLQKDPEARERLIREAKAASRLRHNNILTIYSVEHHEGRDFIVMEYVEGKPLTESSRDLHRTIPQVLNLAIAVAEGLQKAHAAGIIHRDLKPANILVDGDGIPRLVDFGLAKVRGTDKLTKTGSTLGTVFYMSPEQAKGEDVDARSDIFSFGAVLYELITGRTPFQGEHETALAYAIANEPFEPMSRFKTGVSAELERIVAKALAKSPNERYQTVADMAADLRALRHRTAATFPADLHSRSTLRKWIAASAAVIGVAVLSAAAVLLLRPNQSNKSSERKMLAVLPFQNMSSDPDQEYFSDGLTEDLITTLSGVQSLCIVSRSSVMTYKGSPKAVPEIAKELGVQYIVEGSVRRAGNELRINAQLIDAANDAHLWANKYTGTIDDVFDMQDSVTTAIVQGIRVQLTPEESRRVGRREFENPLAYECFLKGREEIYKGTEEAIDRGLKILQSGLSVVGENALLYSKIADGYWNLVNSGFGQDEDIERADAYARKALALDPQLPEALTTLGDINYAFRGNPREAMRLLRKAVALDSTNREGLGSLFVCYLYVGKVSEMISTHEAFAQLYPLDSTRILPRSACNHFYAGQFCPAIPYIRAYRRLELKAPWAEWFAMLVLAYCDSVDAAATIVKECEDANPNSAVTGMMRVFRSAFLGDTAGALQGLTPEVQKTCRRDAMWSWHLGAVLAHVGAKDAAYEWLENGVNRGFVNYPFISKDRFLQNLYGEERFKRLMERVKHEWETFEA